MSGKRKHHPARELRFGTVFLKKVQKNLDNYIYIYISTAFLQKQKAGI